MDKIDNPRLTIFADALEIDVPLERAAFLDRACGTNAALRRDIEELIKAQALAGRFLPEQPGASDAQAILRDGAKAVAPPAAGPHQVAITEKPGDLIGRYKLLQNIGEGGCGVVYMAEQEEPIRRKVALKVIKLGMDTKSVVARFEAERQALALMDHTNIAKVLDAGATETGRPYFVMELVHGIRITQYCDQHELSTRDRLELFIQVCQAVQHAHQKGIIHRDLKPSNILVTVNDPDRSGVPKVIDFGIAKATEGRLADQTLFTAFEQFLGTPAYMSPEQASMTSLDIDTRSDIYSLGVLLYELLTGKTPFETHELVAAGLDELRRTIREKEPSRPSTRLSAMVDGERTACAKHRGIEAPKLIHLLRRDLDWIVMKCLEKDRSRRYETANDLARDIQRHINSEVVVARPPSALYRFQKVVRRNKLPFAAGLAITLALLAGTTASTWQAMRAGREREHVQRNIVRQYVANGTRLMNDGDLFASLLWYTEALRLDAGDLRRETPHRIRIASVLQKSPKLIHLFAHGGLLYHAEFSPDGSKVLTAGDDHTARVWDAVSGKQLLVLPHDDEVVDASFSLDGTRIVTSSQDTTARVWDSRTGALVVRMVHPAPVWQSRFSPDGRMVATACQDRTARIWQSTTGAALGHPLEHDSPVGSLSFSPNGRLLGTSTLQGMGNLWDVTTGRHLFHGPHSGDGISFSPDSQHFITIDNTELRIWETNTFSQISFSPIKFSWINSVVFSPDGGSIVVAGENPRGQVWDMATGKPRFSPGVPHVGQIRNVSVSPDSRSFATALLGPVGQVWSTMDGQPTSPPIRSLVDGRSLTFNRDGRRLLGITSGRAAGVWDLATSEEPATRPPLQSEQLIISPDGHKVLVTESNTVWILDTLSGARLFPLGHTNSVTYVSFSRDGGSVITASERDHTVTSAQNDIFLWDVPTGHRLNHGAMSHRQRLVYAAFSRDNRCLLTCGIDFIARIWDAHTGEPIGKPLWHANVVTWGVFAPDGKTVFTACLDGTARVWDTATGKPQTSPLLHKAMVINAFWSADGARLTTVTEDDTLQVWDLVRSEPLTTSKITKSNDTVPDVTSPQITDQLPCEDRPVADLVRIAQILAGGQIDSNGNLVPLEFEKIMEHWRELSAKDRELFTSTSREILDWHLRQAQESKGEGNSAAAFFHLDCAARQAPQDMDLERQRLRMGTVAGLSDAALKQSRSGSVFPPLDTKAGPDLIDVSSSYAAQQVSLLPRSPNARPEQVDLTSYYNSALHGNGLDFGNLREGLQVLGGVTFDVRGLVILNRQLAERHSPGAPERVDAIQVGRKCARLHFLQAAEWANSDGMLAGHYTLHYSNGQEADLPIIFGQDIWDWWGQGPPAAAKATRGAVPVWVGQNNLSIKGFSLLRLYKSTRENPRPDLDLVSIDFVSAQSSSAPFLVALTVE